MEPEEILARLKERLANVPDCGTDDDIRQEFLDWHAQVRTFLILANPRHELTLNTQERYFAASLLRRGAVQTIRTMITNEVQRLEVMLGPQIQPAYGPGAQYDFYRSLKTLIQSAEREIFLIDPYLDRDAFDLYLGELDPAISARVLTYKYAESLKSVVKILATKHEGVEVRKSEALHDRIFFVDGEQCWIIGQSIKDAADKSPTYLAPLPSEVVAIKLEAYNDIWGEATPITVR